MAVGAVQRQPPATLLPASEVCGECHQQACQRSSACAGALEACCSILWLFG